MKHDLPPLPYNLGALAPTLSEETLDYHYNKHHKAYVDNLNKLIVGTEYAECTLTEIVQKAPSGAIFNNAAQAWNHSFYWESLTPKGQQKPKGALAKAIEVAFGNFDAFKENFSKAATGQFGSGWAWLVKNKEGKLTIETTSNAITPFAQGHSCLLTVDVWEHAYYIDYRNQRAKYLEKLWEIINWDFAEKNFSEA